jgi:glycosyltransferase involved in cell wall biosynthesis
MKVSVLVPVYNCEEYLVQCITSLINQTYANIEILICDDKSHDGSRNIIDKISDSRVVKYFNSSNLGNLRTINLLLEKASGQFITFQDADDWSDPARIQKQVEYLIQHQDVYMCGTDYRYINFDGSQEKLYDLPLLHNSIMTFIEEINSPPFCAASCMIRYEVYKTLGGFRSYFDGIGAADFDWHYRIIEKFKVANLPDVCYFYRKNPNSITFNISEDLRKIVSDKIAFFLYQERKLFGLDSLDQNSLEKIDTYISQFLIEYKNNPSLIFKKISISLIHKGQKTRALGYVIKAIIKEPFKKDNYSLLKYWFWKYFIDQSVNSDLIKQI